MPRDSRPLNYKLDPSSFLPITFFVTNCQVMHVCHPESVVWTVLRVVKVPARCFSVSCTVACLLLRFPGKLSQVHRTFFFQNVRYIP